MAQLLAFGGVLATGTAAAATECPPSLAQWIPERTADAATGREFVHRAAALGDAERETAIAAELLRGNLPSFLGRLQPVTLEGEVAWGGSARITICVMPDYLAIGADDDFLRIPMGLDTAFTVARRFGFVLPTAKMVDAIYQQADVHLRPVPLPPGPEMRSIAYYWDHHQRIREQRLSIGVRPGTLIAGQKKDLVVTNRLRQRRGRVAIYGWHWRAGEPIQPLSTVHGARYADYSHGVRLVSAIAFVDGQPMLLHDVLESPWYASIVSDEGPIRRLAGLMAPAQANGCSITTAC